MSVDTDARTIDKLGAYLDDLVFPCSRDQLLRCAEENEAPDAMLDAIESLPNSQFRNLRHIMRSVEGNA